MRFDFGENHHPGEALPVGKVPAELLRDLLEQHPRRDERLVVGPGYGEDAAVIDFGDRYIVAKTDPITFVSDSAVWYLLAVNGNDIACMGARPKWLLVTALLPEDRTTADDVRALFHDLHTACRRLKIELCGGHTEITSGLERPLLVGQLLGEVWKDRLINKADIAPGDAVVFVGSMAIEATSIIARERGPELVEAYTADLVKVARNFIFDPGISIMRAAQVATAAGTVHGMHDPTEGGVAMGLHELADAPGVGLRINADDMDIRPETKLLCDHFGIDPLGAIASGALLVCCSGDSADGIVEALRKDGLPAKVAGEVVGREAGKNILIDREEHELPSFPTDEITRLFIPPESEDEPVSEA